MAVWVSLAHPVVGQEQQKAPLTEEEKAKLRLERARKKFAFALDKAPKLAEIAPTFSLKSLDGKTETDLGSFRGKRPLVLFFGSYT